LVDNQFFWHSASSGVNSFTKLLRMEMKGKNKFNLKSWANPGQQYGFKFQNQYRNRFPLISIF
jgi:hypothetical protein